MAIIKDKQERTIVNDFEKEIIMIRRRHDSKKYHPLECIFSNIEIASMAMHATISIDILSWKSKSKHSMEIKWSSQ